MNADELIGQLREVCLALPEATEKETWGHPTFRVRDKMFLGCGVDDEGRVTASMKAEPGEQESLLATGHPFFFPKYVGAKGWIGLFLDADTDWDEVRELVTDSYRAIAPKALAKELEA